MARMGLKDKGDGRKLKRKRKPVNEGGAEKEQEKNVDMDGNDDDHLMKKKKKLKLKLLKENLGRNRKVDENLSSQRQCSGETSADTMQVSEVYEIPSVDSDCSKGMKKWLKEYYQRRPGFEILQQQIDDFIVEYEARKEKERKEREAGAAEGGWTVVTHHKGRKKTTDAQSGIAVGSVAEAVILEKIAKSKIKEPAKDFYRFQRREAQRNEVMILQNKFEQDKKRIQQLRAARKFRPF